MASKTSASLERYPYDRFIVPFGEPQRKAWARKARRRVLAPAICVVKQFCSSLRNHGIQPGQCGMRRGRTKVADDKSVRRLIHKSDKGVVRLSRRSQDSCLSSTGLEVSTELNREAVRHSNAQAKASTPAPNCIDSSPVSLTTAAA
jgi:hypothetical protein